MARLLRIAEIWRYPVKSMGGERVLEADVGISGIALDRGWAIYDLKAGTIRGGRNLPDLLLCFARYMAGTSAGLVPHVEITLPDGTLLRSDHARVHQRLSDFLGKKVELIPLRTEGPPRPPASSPVAPLNDKQIEARLRMIFGLNKDESVPNPRLIGELADKAAKKKDYTDAFPIDVLTTSSLRYLQKLLPGTNLDVRRFRPNFLIDDGGESDEMLERDWVGQRLEMGGVELAVVMECLRCTIVAAEQHGGIGRDSNITRTLVREMRQCLGVYCDVIASGSVRIGNTVRVLPNLSVDIRKE